LLAAQSYGRNEQLSEIALCADSLTC